MSRHTSSPQLVLATLCLTILTFLPAPRSEAGVTLILDSQDGDFVGDGQRLSFTSAEGEFSFETNSYNIIRVSFHTPDWNHWWYLNFAAPQDQPLTVGTYTGATRYPFQLPTNPGLDVSGDGTGCNTLTGSFEVREITFGLNNTVESLSVAFEQHCEGIAPALLGELRVNPFITLTAPGAKSVIIEDTLTFTVTATDDVHGRAVALSALDLPPGATFTDRGDSTGTFAWAPAVGQNGTFDVTFEARSDSGHAESAVTRITTSYGIIAPDITIAANLFPDQPGATWTYRIGTSRQNLTMSVLNEKKLINGIETSIFRDGGNYREYYTADEDGLRWHGIRWPNGRTATFEPPLRMTNGIIEFDDSITSNGIVRFSGLRGGTIIVPYSSTISAMRQNGVTVPAGTYDTVRVGGTLNISGQAPAQIWFYLAPGIGVIRSVTAESGDIYKLELVRTSVALFTIDASSLAEGEQSVAYNSSLDISPFGVPYSVNIVSGSLPAGLTLDNQGMITGVPTPKAKSAKFTVEVSERGSHVQRAFTIKVFNAIKIKNKGLKKGTAGKIYTATLKTTGGKGPYTWSLVSGTLPLGLVLNSATGSISGAPTQLGLFTPVFKVTDSLGGVATKTLSIIVK
jgi:hypothetical protein